MLPDPSTTKTKLNFCVTQAVKKNFSKSAQVQDDLTDSIINVDINTNIEYLQ